VRISPEPPVADLALPWDAPVEDAVAAVAAARARHGDTFAVVSGRDTYLFVFSPTGVESFYALPEEAASKGVADYLMLRRKLPDEVFDGRRTLPGTLFRKGDVAVYLSALSDALDTEVALLGDSGAVDLFALTRRLGHRMGLASWGGPGSAAGEAFSSLERDLDVLDGAASFVHPDAMRAVAESGYAAERAALARVLERLGPAVDLVADAPDNHGLFGRIVAAWSDVPADERRRGAALDVVLVHVASMSNLNAALGWVLVDLLEHPDALDRVRGGDEAFASRCALESTRLAPRSIMSRHVLQPVSVDTGAATYDVGAGVTVATLLPLTNLDPALGHDTWDPERWDRHRFTDTAGLGSPQLVTAFGHGRHTCPAQPFSLAAMSTAARRLLAAYDLVPRWTAHPRPVPAQIGGVARADGPCLVDYRARRDG
jgi:cytochrome P450